MRLVCQDSISFYNIALQDYRPYNRTISITSSRSTYIYIYCIDDEVDEDPETIIVRLEQVDDRDLPVQFVEQAVVTIRDNDGTSACLNL